MIYSSYVLSAVVVVVVAGLSFLFSFFVRVVVVVVVAAAAAAAWPVLPIPFSSGEDETQRRGGLLAFVPDDQLGEVGPGADVALGAAIVGRVGVANRRGEKGR